MSETDKQISNTAGTQTDIMSYKVFISINLHTEIKQSIFENS